MSSGMVSARPAATCLRCGAAMAARTGTCANCGTPAPAPAGTGVRVAALTIDVAAVASLSSVVMLATHSVAFALVAAVEAMVALWIAQARFGAGLGNLLMRVRVTRVDRPYTPGGARALARGLFVGGGMFFLVVGAWLVEATGALDRRAHRSWADYATGTMVVEVPRTVRDAPARPARTQAAPRPVTASGAAQIAPRPPSREIAPQPVAREIAPQPEIVPPPIPPQPAPATRAEARRAAAVRPAPPAAAPSPPAAAPPPAAPASPPPARTEPPIEHAPQQPVVRAAEHTGSQPPIETLLPPVSGPTGMLLVFDTGQREVMPVPCAVNLGRSPESSESDDLLVVVDDPARSVSKTHARIEITEEGTWVTDLSSTNGTELVFEDGLARTARPDARTFVEDGVRVQLGERKLTLTPLMRGDG